MEISKQNLSQLFSVKQPFLSAVKNACIKFLGNFLGISFIFTAFWLFPEYHNYKYFIYIEEAVSTFLIFFLPISFLYILAIEIFVGPEEDVEYFFGKVFFLDIENVNWQKVRNGILEWIICLFFLTLNFLVATTLVSNFRLGNPFVLGTDFLTSVLSVLGIFYLLIIFTILPGYLFSSRLIKTQVRKVDRNLLAWVVTFACYPPFFDLLSKEYFNYGGTILAKTGEPAWYFFTNHLYFWGVPVFFVFNSCFNNSF
jgi:hypothetical protein